MTQILFRPHLIETHQHDDIYFIFPYWYEGRLEAGERRIRRGPRGVWGEGWGALRPSWPRGAWRGTGSAGRTRRSPPRPPRDSSAAPPSAQLGSWIVPLSRKNKTFSKMELMYFLDREDLLPASSGILRHLVKVTLSLLFSFLLNSESFISSELGLSVPASISSFLPSGRITNVGTDLPFVIFSERNTCKVVSWVNFNNDNAGLTHVLQAAGGCCMERGEFCSTELQSCIFWKDELIDRNSAPVCQNAAFNLYIVRRLSCIQYAPINKLYV